MNNLNGTLTARYDIDDTITIGGFVYDIVVLDYASLDQHGQHQQFTGSPGTDDNQDFGVAFPDADGQFKVFAHFTLDYV